MLDKKLMGDAEGISKRATEIAKNQKEILFLKDTPKTSELAESIRALARKHNVVLEFKINEINPVEIASCCTCCCCCCR